MRAASNPNVLKTWDPDNCPTDTWEFHAYMLDFDQPITAPIFYDRWPKWGGSIHMEVDVLDRGKPIAPDSLLLKYLVAHNFNYYPGVTYRVNGYESESFVEAVNIGVFGAQSN